MMYGFKANSFSWFFLFSTAPLEERHFLLPPSWQGLLPESAGRVLLPGQHLPKAPLSPSSGHGGRIMGETEGKKEEADYKRLQTFPLVRVSLRGARQGGWLGSPASE